MAFAKLAEARALGRLGAATSASSALSRAEALLDKIQSETHDPMWISYVTYGRLAADATEIFRDLRNPKAALRWSEQASDMSGDVHTRVVGLRLAVVATAACQARDLDQALDSGHRALDILAQVTSTGTSICFPRDSEKIPQRSPILTTPRSPGSIPGR